MRSPWSRFFTQTTARSASTSRIPIFGTLRTLRISPPVTVMIDRPLPRSWVSRFGFTPERGSSRCCKGCCGVEVFGNSPGRGGWAGVDGGGNGTGGGLGAGVGGGSTGDGAGTAGGSGSGWRLLSTGGRCCCRCGSGGGGIGSGPGTVCPGGNIEPGGPDGGAVGEGAGGPGAGVGSIACAGTRPDEAGPEGSGFGW